MKTIQPIAFGIAMSLFACGHEEPPKSAAEADTPTAPQMAKPQPRQNLASEPTANPPTSADVPHEGQNAGNPVAAEAPAAPTEAQAESFTDGQILQVTHVANTGEIDQARLVQAKSNDARVRKLAAMMMRDHSQAETKGSAVAKKAGLSREPSTTSAAIESDAQRATRTLKAEAGADFDKDYVETQIREHQAVLDTIDQKLLPSVKSADLKMYLDDVRASVASHLKHAQDLLAEMQK